MSRTLVIWLSHCGLRIGYCKGMYVLVKREWNSSNCSACVPAPHDSSAYVTVTHKANSINHPKQQRSHSQLLFIQLSISHLLSSAQKTCSNTNTLDITTKMSRALILVANGSEEIEFVTPYDGTCLFLHEFAIAVTKYQG